MTTTFLFPSDDRWTAVLQDTPHDVYHRPAYLRAAASCEDGRPVAFYAKDDSGILLLPLLLRAIPDTDAHDAASPYGYPAPLWTTPDPTPHWTAFLRAARDRGLVSVFIRLHPLLPAPTVSASNPSTAIAHVEHGPTVWIDCTQSPDSAWDDTRSGHRSDIRRLQQQDFDVEVVQQPTDGLDEALDTFVDLYLETMDRVGADSFYYFSEDYFTAWTDALRPYCCIAIVRAPDGAPAAAGLFTITNGWIQYHLSGTNSTHRKKAPSKLMLHHVRSRALDSGLTRLHLGGGLGGTEDSLFFFKAGFSSSRATFSSLRMVCRPDAYRSLCPSDEGFSPSNGFFPLYRKD